ncbi:ubiquitin conjugation factor E4 A-like [Octopus vulgaris]|uniref:Ubiquitin conjugation factor E4 A n=1 Tax=Octopus vulgaris TaxID=6645 RepID=A0AA36BT91_OCTVU|nr:ubiquitin conjugation factor E4 A-like [Octopus vulgaris]
MRTPPEVVRATSGFSDYLLCRRIPRFLLKLDNAKYKMSGEDISSNPFAALLPSGSHPQECTKKLAANEDKVADTAKTDDGLSERFKASCIIGEIFLVTLDPDDIYSCPKVYLKDINNSQTWLDLECLNEVVLERLLLEDPKESILFDSKSAKSEIHLDQDWKNASEQKSLHYLFGSFLRAQHLLVKYRGTSFEHYVKGCQNVALTNAKLCLQQPELVCSQSLPNQFIDIFFSNYKTVLGDNCMVMLDFFTRLANEVHKFTEDGSVKEAFQPILDVIYQHMTNELNLMHVALFEYLDLLTFFHRSEPLALAFLEHSTPQASTGQASSPKSYEKTLLGCILSFSCIPVSDSGPYEFFNNPSAGTKTENDIIEANIWKALANLGDKVHQLFHGLIKVSDETRHQVLNWLANCLHSNEDRAKLWTAQMRYPFDNIYCSDRFFLNLCYVMLKLCQPFCKNISSKIFKIDPTYTAAVVTSDEDAKKRNIHAKDLMKLTCLISKPENEEDLASSSNQTYNFITECFYLTHFCLMLGFQVLNDKFMRLSQELHRIQRTYADAHEREGEDGMPTSIKEQLEIGVTIFLSLKAALTEPQLLDMSLQFHITTAVWLSQIAVFGKVDKTNAITFPLAKKPPTILATIPEITLDNLTTFTKFVTHYKPETYQAAGDSLDHLMTVILVFMGSPERMSNPHLRASLAESLSSLIPPSENRHGNMIGLNLFYEGKIFHTHYLSKHVAEMLLHVFVSIEMTGQSVAFEQKFNYRRPMYAVLEYIWEIPLHREAIKELVAYAEENIEAPNAPLFLRFINLLINDAIFLLDEALSYMMQIKEKQQEEESETWRHLSDEQQQEHTSNLRQISMLARYHNIMANSTIQAIELLTTDIKSIFTHDSMVTRISEMLNYFLVHLVGPKQKNFNVKDKNEYEFKPQQIVSNICKTYLNLAENEKFCFAVLSDGRSYSESLLIKAKHILHKIGWSQQDIESFEALDQKIKDLGVKQKEEDEMLSEAPDEFLDPIMGTLMKDPVILPTSQKTLDRTVIARHLLSDQSDPFSRKPLTMDKVIPNVDLKDKIDRWLRENRKRIKEY